MRLKEDLVFTCQIANVEMHDLGDRGVSQEPGRSRQWAKILPPPPQLQEYLQGGPLQTHSTRKAWWEECHCDLLSAWGSQTELLTNTNLVAPFQNNFIILGQWAIPIKSFNGNVTRHFALTMFINTLPFFFFCFGWFNTSGGKKNNDYHTEPKGFHQIWLHFIFMSMKAFTQVLKHVHNGLTKQPVVVVAHLLVEWKGL